MIAVDWSGAKDRRAQITGIRVAEVRAGGSTVSGGRTREETIEYVTGLRGPVLAGFDFSFGFPAWFAHERGCESIADVWALAERHGEAWLAPTAPFWRKQCNVPAEQRFRACEARLRAAGFPAKSIFQLVGNGQVGAGSVRGMPLLTRLRAAGFAIWPFDPPTDRTAVEIYPSMLRTLVPHDGTKFADEHERDAVLSAATMWEHRASFATLAAATDQTTLIEGDVWTPPAPADIPTATP